MIDIDLSIYDIPDDEASNLWARLSIVARAFLDDGYQVELSTFPHDDHDDYDDDADLTPDSTEETQQ